MDSLHYIILRLLGRPEDETSLECLCVLLTEIGKQLETAAMQTPDEESASSSSVRSQLDLSRYKSSNCWLFCLYAADGSREHEFVL